MGSICYGLTNPGDQIGGRVEHRLQQFPDLRFLGVRLDLENPVQNVPFLQNAQRQIIKAQVQNLDPGMRDPRDQSTAILVHRQPLLCRKRADEEGHFIAKPLLRQKPLTGHDLEEMLNALLCGHGRFHVAASCARPGK